MNTDFRKLTCLKPPTMEYFVKKGSKRLGPFSVEQLSRQELNADTRIWYKGLSDWKKLKDIPELTDLYSSIPPSGSNGGKWVGILFFLVAIAGAGWYFFIRDKAKPISTADLYQQYSKSVALIKHSFLYKIHIGDKDYYFKSYDKQSGETSSLLSLDSAKNDPNVSWGTGFFIDDKGQMLTCRHVVEVSPSAEEEKMIFNFLKQKYSNSLESYTRERAAALQEYQKYDEVLKSYSSGLDFSSYYDFLDRKKAAADRYNIADFAVNFCQDYLNLVNAPNNFVGKTSFQFGIFLNDTTSTTLNDYIKCQRIKTSNDPEVDLALIQTESKKLPHPGIKPIALKRIEHIEKEPIKINEKVRMIGFNDGIFMASTSRGIKSQITEGQVSQQSDEFKMMYTIPALPGSSGSPVFDEYGELVGVNFAGRTNSQSFNFGIQPRKVKAFLDK